MAGNAEPLDSNYRSIGNVLLSPGNGLVVAQGGSTILTDSATGQQYAPAIVQQVAPSSISGTLQSAAVATGAGTALSLLGEGSVQFTVTGTFVGTITWQGSEDGTNYSSIYATQLGTNTIATTATTTGVYEASCAGLQLVRANITAYTSGSITVTAHAVPGSFSPRVTYAVIQATGGTALAADVSNSELRVSTYVKSSAAGDTALTLGQAAMAASLPVVIASNQSALTTSFQSAATGGYSYTNITSATTTLVKSGAGTLHAIVVNTPVASGVIEFDDALTHTTPKIGTITFPGTLVSDGPIPALYDLAFATGLSITTTGTMDITVVWK